MWLHTATTLNKEKYVIKGEKCFQKTAWCYWDSNIEK